MPTDADRQKHPLAELYATKEFKDEWAKFLLQREAFLKIARFCDEHCFEMTVVMDTEEGNMMVTFVKGDRRGHIEIYQDGTGAAVIVGSEVEPRAWDAGDDWTGTVARIKEFLG